MTTNFIVCHKKYLTITNNRCAAELLHFFKNYKPSRKDGWLIITIMEIKEKLLDTWGRDAIRRGCQLLDDLGLIKRSHPRLNKRAWMYQFVNDKLVENPTTVDENPTTVDENPTTTYIKDPISDPSLEPEEKKTENVNSEPEPTQVDSTPPQTSMEVPVKKENNSGGLAFRRCQKSFSKIINWDWIPEGPWKLDGKIDPELIDWQARRWLSKGWGIDIHEARKKIRAYYKNDPTRLGNDWQEYQEATAHKLANMLIREKNGIAIADSEKQQLSKNISNAFQHNPRSFSVPNIGEVEKYQKWLNAEDAIDWDELSVLVEDWEQSQIEAMPGTPAGADNPQCYTQSVSESDRNWAYQQYLKAMGNLE